MEKHRSFFSVFALVCALLLFGSAAFSQVLSGTITGTVLDPHDLAIAGAKVTITDLATGKEYPTTTDSTGDFTVTALPKGEYKVTVEVQGFAKYTIGHVVVNVAQTSKVNAKMELARAAVTEVIVTAEQATVDTESAELKSSVNREQIINLPLPTRNPLDLVRVMPGIVSPTASGIGDSFVHGLRGNSTNITQDGINVADNFVKTSSFFAISAPTVDTVGEFNVSIGGIGTDAGYGAAQVSIVTQRGSNDFHGSLFWFQRTNALNANTWFNDARGLPTPFQLQNRIGASAGGPVFIPKVYDGRNKTWLFGTYEAFREPLSRNRTRVVLTPSARTGSFTYTDPGGTRHTVNLLSLGTVNGGPASIDSAVMNFYNSLVPTDPLTDQGCAQGDTVNIRCFSFNLPGRGSVNRYTLRADHQLFKNHSIEFVFNQADFNSTPDLLNGIEPNFPKSPGGSQVSRRQVLTWAVHSSFGSNKTNEGRFGYQRAPVQFKTLNDFSGTNGFQLQSPGVLTDPTLTSNNLPQGRNTPVRQITDNFAWVKGRHTMRFGGEWRWLLANSFFFNTVVPRVTIGTNSANQNGLTASSFPGSISSGDLTRANTVFNQITGLISVINQGFNHTSPKSGFVAGVPRTVDPSQHNFAGYFQDSFKFKPNLTLTAGLRHEYQGRFDLRNGLILLPGDFSSFWGPTKPGDLFDPGVTSGATDTLLNFAGGGAGKPVYGADTNNFAPFFGFAWDPFKNGRTSIRGGATVHYTQDGFTLFQLSSTGNTGLFTVSSACDTTKPNCATGGVQTGAYNPASVPAPVPPVDQFPVSQVANFRLTGGGANLWFFNPNLRTPYVVEWNLSVSRELWKKTTVEARYVGNRGISLYRSYSINELNLLNSPFTAGGASVSNILTEFQHAQTNLAAFQLANPNCDKTGQPACTFANNGLPGQLPLPILQTLFNGVSGSAGFASSTFKTLLNQNQVGAMFDTLRRSPTYADPGNGTRRGAFPLNFFVANPWANQANLVDNSSWSTFHGFEFEVRRRFAGGLFFQANYTFSKVITDQRFLTSQNEGQVFRSLLNRSLDRNRAGFDVTHSINANFIYPLPVGRGKWLAGNANGFVDKLIGGWQVQGTTHLSTGSPFTIYSNRQTAGALVGVGVTADTTMLRNMTPTQLQSFIGVFRTPNGVFWLDPKSGLYKTDSTGAITGALLCTSPTQTTPCFDHPGAGQEGNTPYFGFTSPHFINQDLGIIKRTNFPKVSEHFNFEIRFEFFNLFNHPNFNNLSGADVVSGSQTSIDSTSFGKLNDTVDTARGGGVNSRIIQWAIKVNW